MAGQNQTDLFDAYFRRADLDQDGRISGAEAVAFFQGSNLPKQVLAQIWTYADQNRTGFLGRREFYNALKLVTVAQSKRELTPEMVKAALYGPASAKIPAPQINIPVTPAPQLNSRAATAVPQIGGVAPPTSQNMGMNGPQSLPSASNNFSSQQMQFTRAPPPRPPNLNVSTDLLGGTLVGPRVGPAPNSGMTPAMTSDGYALPTSGLASSAQPRPQIATAVTPLPAPGLPSQSQSSASKDSKALGPSGNGFPPVSVFGGDVFSATPSQPKPNLSPPSFSAPVSSSSGVQVSAVLQPPVKSSSLDSLQGAFSLQSTSSQPQQSLPAVSQNQNVTPRSTIAHNSARLPGEAGQSASNQTQLPWPRMTQTDVQKYTKVFMEVDTDRDGKITGEQARNLFLSWRLPREVLKQVWDLSDRDNDSMLSSREFCTALYLMERYREGRPLPAVLPSGIMFDETPTPAYGNAVWGSTPAGLQQRQGMVVGGALPVGPAAGLRPSMQVPAPQADSQMQSIQKKSSVPVLEKHLVNQLSKEEQNSLNSKYQEATEADKKVEDLEKEILDSKEKIEYFRTKMQELVLYKSRCDNRLNEITERAAADKREVESLAKKYEEKYKQVGDLASKLTIEEATFRDIQERKMELYQAIVKMEQGGSADGILQVRADRIQSDLEELVKALNERCKKYGLRVKPTALVELPFGWQPGIREEAADWDEDWDKFEDEGFTFVKELTLDVQNVVAPPKTKTPPIRKETTNEGANKSDAKSDKVSSTNEKSPYNDAEAEEGSTISTPRSPSGRSILESPSEEFHESRFRKSISGDGSPHGKDTQSEHGGAESVVSGDKSFDEPGWGVFDTHYDTDSVWGFSTKDENERLGENAFFRSGELGLNPIRTESPRTDNMFQQRSLFADSVPSTPLFNSGHSPRSFGEGSDEHSFDNFSRFDSFSTHDSGGFFQPPNSIARFDSIRSTTTDYAHGHGFTSFDDSDPFGSSGPFKTSLESQTPRRASDNWSSF